MVEDHTDKWNNWLRANLISTKLSFIGSITTCFTLRPWYKIIRSIPAICELCILLRLWWLVRWLVQVNSMHHAVNIKPLRCNNKMY
jgi:hypothetical protein